MRPASASTDGLLRSTGRRSSACQCGQEGPGSRQSICPCAMSGGWFMRYLIEIKDVSQKEDLGTLVGQLSAKLEKKLKSIPAGTLFLRVLKEKVTRDMWRASVKLDVPGRVLTAREENRDAHTATRAAFAELDRQVDAYKSAVRGEAAWKRTRRRRVLRQKKGAAGSTDIEGGSLLRPGQPAC